MSGHRVEIKSDFQLGALGVVFRFAARALNGRFKSAQTTHFIHQALRIDLPFQTLQGSIDGLAFSNDYFRHKFTYFLKNWTSRVCNTLRIVKWSFFVGPFFVGGTSKCTTEVTASKTRKAGAKASSAFSGKSLCRDHEAFITSRLEVGLSA
jgi:hypothetical protein